MKKQQRNACAVKASIGGQALMEGIMMRGPEKCAMAVRNTKGEIVLEEVEMKQGKRPAICKWPIVRGVFGFIDSMSLGYKCLMRSAEISGLEDLVEESPSKKKKKQEDVSSATESIKAAVDEKKDEKEEEKLPAWSMVLMTVISVVLAVALALGLFFFLPSFLYELLATHIPFFTVGSLAVRSLIKSVFEGIFKIVLLIAYMSAISLMKEIRRTYMYHGAEHKTIFCYEAGLELTVENVRRQGRFHPRCGTSFLILMLLVGVFVSFFIDPVSILITGSTLHVAIRVVVKILTFPIVMGIGYELIKFAGRHDNWLTRVISAPGVALQHLTVFEPTDDMIECAIASVKCVLPDETNPTDASTQE